MSCPFERVIAEVIDKARHNKTGLTLENIHEEASKMNGRVENGDTLCVYEPIRELVWKRKVGQSAAESVAFMLNPKSGEWDIPWKGGAE